MSFRAIFFFNARYDVNFDNYDGIYKKDYWQGYSIDVGFGSDYKISQKVLLQAQFLILLLTQFDGMNILSAKMNM